MATAKELIFAWRKAKGVEKERLFEDIYDNFGRGLIYSAMQSLCVQYNTWEDILSICHMCMLSCLRLWDPAKAEWSTYLTLSVKRRIITAFERSRTQELAVESIKTKMLETGIKNSYVDENRYDLQDMLQHINKMHQDDWFVEKEWQYLCEVYNMDGKHQYTINQKELRKKLKVSRQRISQLKEQTMNKIIDYMRMKGYTLPEEN